MTREDIFGDYDRQSFEKVFGALFVIGRSENIPGSQRTLYLMEKRQ